MNNGFLDLNSTANSYDDVMFGAADMFLLYLWGYQTSRTPLRYLKKRNLDLGTT